jgi:hypothetical protein
MEQGDFNTEGTEFTERRSRRRRTSEERRTVKADGKRNIEHGSRRSDQLSTHLL